MPDVLMNIFRALIYQADRKPGVPALATLKRGLQIRVTRSPGTNYKLEAGRKNVYSDERELSVLTVNWPNRVVCPVEWQQALPEVEDPMRWMVAILHPVGEGEPCESKATASDAA